MLNLERSVACFIQQWSAESFRNFADADEQAGRKQSKALCSALPCVAEDVALQECNKGKACYKNGVELLT